MPINVSAAQLNKYHAVLAAQRNFNQLSASFKKFEFIPSREYFTNLKQALSDKCDDYIDAVTALMKEGNPSQALILKIKNLTADFIKNNTEINELVNGSFSMTFPLKGAQAFCSASSGVSIEWPTAPGGPSTFSSAAAAAAVEDVKKEKK